MGTVVLDASVVIGLRDPQDAHHESAVETVQLARAARDRLVLPASALAEMLVGACRLGQTAVASTEEFVDAVIDAVQPIDRAVARSAASYRARRSGLRLPDALVLAVGEVIDADTVYTADARWKGWDRRVQVIL
jgi:predicted nucleic acid-binding protein